MSTKKKSQITVTDVVKIRLPVSKLQIGMYVSTLDCPWEETPFMFQGFLIETPEEIATIKNYSEYAVVDRSRSHDVATPKRTPSERTASIEITSSKPKKRQGLFSLIKKKKDRATGFDRPAPGTATGLFNLHPVPKPDRLHLGGCT